MAVKQFKMQNLKRKTKDGAVPHTSINRILIKAPNWLGDSVMSIPTVRGMKRLFPQAELWVYSRSNLCSLWRLVPEVKGAISNERGESSLISQGFDMVLILTNSFGSALRMFFTRIPQRRGYRINSRGWLLTQPVELMNGWKNMHQIEYFLGLIEGLAKVDLSSPCSKRLGIDTTPRISISLELQDQAKEFFTRYGWRDGEPIVGIHATANYGSAKCWLPGRFAELIGELKNVYNPWILMCGSREEEKDIEGILERLPDRERIVSVAGQTDIAELAALISLCNVFVANDSGPMHLASAIGVPVTAIFGSTDPKRTGPRGKAVIIKEDISCSPCFKRKCPKTLECMCRVSVEDVMQAVGKLWN